MVINPSVIIPTIENQHNPLKSDWNFILTNIRQPNAVFTHRGTHCFSKHNKSCHLYVAHSLNKIEVYVRDIEMYISLLRKWTRDVLVITLSGIRQQWGQRRQNRTCAIFLLHLIPSCLTLHPCYPHRSCAVRLIWFLHPTSQNAIPSTTSLPGKQSIETVSKMWSQIMLHRSLVCSTYPSIDYFFA